MFLVELGIAKVIASNGAGWQRLGCTAILAVCWAQWSLPGDRSFDPFDVAA